MNLICLKQKWKGIKREKNSMLWGMALLEKQAFSRGRWLWLGFLLVSLRCSEVASGHTYDWDPLPLWWRKTLSVEEAKVICYSLKSVVSSQYFVYCSPHIVIMQNLNCWSRIARVCLCQEMKLALKLTKCYKWTMLAVKSQGDGYTCTAVTFTVERGNSLMWQGLYSIECETEMLCTNASMHL